VRECSRRAVVDELIDQWLRGAVGEARDHPGIAAVVLGTGPGAHRDIAIQQAFAHRSLALSQGDDHAAPADFGVAVDALFDGVLVLARERENAASVK
jgi:hypothetical protein